jgi:hypothetical protein
MQTQEREPTLWRQLLRDETFAKLLSSNVAPARMQSLQESLAGAITSYQWRRRALKTQRREERTIIRTLVQLERFAQTLDVAVRRIDATWDVARPEFVSLAEATLEALSIIERECGLTPRMRPPCLEHTAPVIRHEALFWLRWEVFSALERARLSVHPSPARGVSAQIYAAVLDCVEPSQSGRRLAMHPKSWKRWTKQYDDEKRSISEFRAELGKVYKPQASVH